jgi:cytochrome bd-type quinol oxidase subunit 2
LALYFAVGRILVEVGVLPGKPPKEYSTIYSFFTSSMPAPFIAFVAIYPIFVLCRARFQKAHAFGTATVIIFLAAVFSFLPRIVPASVSLWCLPALLFGGGSSSSIGCYFGAALQSAIGAWLLIWFRPRSSPNENDDV